MRVRKISGFVILAAVLVGGPLRASHGRGASDETGLRSVRLAGPPGAETSVSALVLAGGREIALSPPLPLYSMVVDGRPETASSTPSGLTVSVEPEDGFKPGTKLRLIFRNVSKSKVTIENLVPLAQGEDRVYITAGLPNEPPHHLSRTLLFRPGLRPLGVVLPDNAWHLGFCSVEAGNGMSATALARRVKTDKAERTRWASTLEPGGSVEYALYFEAHPGGWRRGLEIMFRERFLYDLEAFDDALFRRTDLAWVRRAHLMVLQFAWDRTYYDGRAGRYFFDETLVAWDGLLGPIDIYAIWPTWPRLGLDARNQWDMYRDLPGGLAELRRQVDLAHKLGKKYFISYNPWDESTRHEDHLAGMEAMLRTLDADGVVLDTRGSSSREFQEAADKVKPGIIMYSEGMAVPRDMPGIVSGRVHDALYMPPPLNLNKYIKPDFAIFRVLQLAEGPLHREAAVAFFNGYGSEINTMRPGRPDWVEEELRYLGKTTMLLRQNATAFLDPAWEPLVAACEDGLWANRWRDGPKTVFTVLSLRPEGYKGPLVEVDMPAGSHLVSFWNHEELTPVLKDGRFFAPVDVAAFDAAALGTRREANVDCLAVLPERLRVEADGEIVAFEAPGAPAGSRISVSAGHPSPSNAPASFGTEPRTIALHEHFGFREEKFVVQLFDARGEILDERVVRLPLAHPRLMTRVERTAPARSAPPGMVEIPAGTFVFKTSGNPDDANPVIPYPDTKTARSLEMRRYFMDRTPVTNASFAAFLRATGYAPKDESNFLKHWAGGAPPAGQAEHPVIWVSLEDARAYARWAGKRLPTEAEWQYAAQGTDGRAFPWGAKMEPGRCNDKLNRTTPVGAFPKGASPFGALDMVGNVWQIMDDVYDNGVYRYGIIRGGSHYAPEKSVWYVKSGPLAVDRVQIHLLVAPGLDRAATVGFRCVKDAD
ncbi:MAG: formylglycine-generating enzyme family protein [Candidatus Aminicenantes bacterium]|nr:formylglycine-generating enzyme family protein [Candidatus Aminicenantes bacterium]